jgi:hypothetical protein
LLSSIGWFQPEKQMFHRLLMVGMVLLGGVVGGAAFGCAAVILEWSGIPAAILTSVGVLVGGLATTHVLE